MRALALTLVSSFILQSAFVRAQSLPSSAEESHGHHATGTRSHLFEGIGFLRLHSEDGIATEILVEIHPEEMPLGFGILVGAYGIPSRDGSVNLDARFVLHLHRPHPLDVRLLIGFDECVTPFFRTLANATLHMTTSWDIAPLFAPSVSIYPASWGSSNHDEIRLELPLGARFHIHANGHPTATWASIAAFLNFPDLRTFSAPHAPASTEAHGPWSLGFTFILEQRLF